MPPSSLCDPKRVRRVGFVELVRNLVPLPASSTKRGRGVVLEAPGLDYEEIKQPASKTNTNWLEVIQHAFGVGTSHGLTRTHMTHHGPDSGGSHHLPPYSILCSSARRLHPNDFFSQDSQGGVPKLSQFGLSGLWASITSRPEFGSRQGLNQSCSSPRELSNAMSHTVLGRREEVESRLLVVGSQTANLTPGPSFAHNLGCRCANGQCEGILEIYTSRTFE